MNLKTSVIYACLGWVAAFAVASPSMAVTIPPQRREATMVEQFGNTLDSGRSSSAEDVGFYYAADLVIPAATVRELSEYATQAGHPEAIRWFCDAYAEPTDGEESASLHGLANKTFDSDAPVGPGAANALVCPSSGSTLPGRVSRSVRGPGASKFAIDGVPLAVGTCQADHEARATFDRTDCESIFTESARRKRSFLSMVRRAAQHDACLRLRINEHVQGNKKPQSVLTIDETTESCEMKTKPRELASPSSCKIYSNPKAPFCVGGKCNLCGPILDKYLKLGGPKGLLGLPITDSLWTPKKPGAYAHFTNGSIFYSTATGAHEVHGRIRDKYAALGWENSYLGFPKTDETSTPKKPGRYNHFEGGSIYWSLPTDAHTIRGRIRDKWASLGWENSFLGFPTTDETSTPKKPGAYNHFQGGSIYWSLPTDAHVIYGAIRDKWARLGWENSLLGFPTTDELPTPRKPGRYNHFQYGSIYWSAGTGAHEVHGAIRDKWASLGWENSLLGFPTSDEFFSSQGRRSDFQNGCNITMIGTTATVRCTPIYSDANYNTGIKSTTFYIPRDTTREMAAQAEFVGELSVRKWLCDNYALRMEEHQATWAEPSMDEWMFNNPQFILAEANMGYLWKGGLPVLDFSSWICQNVAFVKRDIKPSALKAAANGQCLVVWMDIGGGWGLSTSGNNKYCH